MARFLKAVGKPPWPLLFAIAAAGHIIALIQPQNGAVPLLCGNWGQLALGDPASALAYALAWTDLSMLVQGWGGMMLVMMPPLLGWPVLHVWRSSLSWRRPRAVSVFLVTYGVIWLMAGVPVVAIGFILRTLLGAGAGSALILMLGALVWSASPWQRAALNRGHRLMRIGICGWKADRDAFIFGMSHGGWCVASCWPWMVAPMVTGKWHVLVMAIATVAMFVERLWPPSRPRWRSPIVLLPFTLPRNYNLRPRAQHG